MSHPLGWGFALVAGAALIPITVGMAWAMWESSKWGRK